MGSELDSSLHNPPPASTATSHPSHVNVDYFDPEGMRELVSQDSTPTLTSASRQSLQPQPSGSWNFQEAIQRIVRRAQDEQPKMRTLGVSFENLTVTGIGADSSHLSTVGSSLNPLSIVEAIQDARHPHVRTILSDFNGVVRPGEMLLVLGNPGSGCSTLLKTLANQTQEYHKVEGKRHYDSFTPQEVQKNYRGEAVYCPEDDVHFPTLKVKDTLNFAVATRTPHERSSDLSRHGFVEYVTDMLATVFGLRHALKTVVGDAAVRGVSGGEKKRVSISEILATRPCLASWDNSTRGLDSSTALEYVKALRIATDTFQLTSIVSIYQAGDNLFDHFDKVCVIYEGRMAYFGRADQAKQYFIDMGYDPVNRQTTPDFLTAVTDPLARTVRGGAAPPPRTAQEFAEYFNKSRLGSENREDIAAYKYHFTGNEKHAASFVESMNADKVKYSRPSSPYMISLARQVRIVMIRRLLIMRGDFTVTAINLFSYVFQGLIMGSTFYDTPTVTSAFFSRGGVLFFSLLFAALTAMAEIPSLYPQRKILTRHQKAALYHPFIDALGMTLVDIPISFLITGVFSILVYFLVQLQQSAAQFFTFFLFVFIMTICMKAWFRFLASLFPSEHVATAFAGVSVLIFAIYAGYQIPKPSMIGALRWLNYINPMRYGFEAIMANEFHTIQGLCSNLVPQGPGYENITLDNQVCPTVGAVSGELFVDGNRFLGLSFDYFYSNTWRNLGIMAAFTAGFIVLLLIFTEISNSVAAQKSVVLFKRGSEPLAHKAKGQDVEKGHSTHTSTAEKGKDNHHQLAMTNTFSWHQMNYTVPVEGGHRQLLNQVSGFVAPGKLTALMGESGAGKTTLLNVLASRVSIGVVSGDRMVNGQELPPDFQAQTGYCQQMDTHMPLTTVREALRFSAKLRQPHTVPEAEKIEWAEECLKMCGLEHHAEAIVGTLSVEHRKRTTIAVELAAKPKLLLFLDEPTSGLDSRSAWAIISFLRTLANNGQAILCTVHQPSAELFQSFDRLLLLQKGGKTCYFGDIGPDATTLINYFESQGARKCMPGENPAEWMLDVIGAGATAVKTANWAALWNESTASANLQTELKDLVEKGRHAPPLERTLHTEFATPWFYQTLELLKRLFVSYWRDSAYIFAKLFLNIFGGLFVGFSFWRSASSQQGTQNKLFAVFMATIIGVPLANQLQVPWIQSRNIYEIRERPSRMYRWTALLTAQILVEIPWNILGSSILFFCWYWTVGFDTDRAGYSYLLFCVVQPLYYQTFAQAVASMAPTAELAAVLFSFLFSFVITFNGVLQPYSQLDFWRWMYRLSPYTYLIEGLVGQAIGRQSMACSDREIVTIQPPDGETCLSFMTPWISNFGGYLINPDATSACQFCSTDSTDTYLAQTFNMFYSHRWRNIGILIGFAVFNVFLVFLLTFLFRIKRGSLFSFVKHLKLSSRK